MNQSHPPYVTKRKTMNETIQLLLNEAPHYAHEMCVSIMLLGTVVLLVLGYFDKLKF